jgi:DNA-binding CsgD family transcriptional regulator
MSKSQRLRLGEVRAVFRLVGECRELGADVHAWRRHLIAGLCRLTGALLGTAFEGKVALPEGVVTAVRADDVGWPCPAARRRYQEWLDDPTVAPAQIEGPFYRLPAARVTQRREQLLDNRVWFRSEFFNEVLRPFGLCDGLLSRFPLPGGWVFAVGMVHPSDVPAAGRRESRLIHLTLREVEPLVGTALATAADPSPSALPPRQRQVLGCLLEGDGEKEAARRLKLRPDTLHEYVKAIYRRFGVSSRAELMALFLRRFRGGAGGPC